MENKNIFLVESGEDNIRFKLKGEGYKICQGVVRVMGENENAELLILTAVAMYFRRYPIRRDAFDKMMRMNLDNLKF